MEETSVTGLFDTILKNPEVDKILLHQPMISNIFREVFSKGLVTTDMKTINTNLPNFFFCKLVYDQVKDALLLS